MKNTDCTIVLSVRDADERLDATVESLLASVSAHFRIFCLIPSMGTDALRARLERWRDRDACIDVAYGNRHDYFDLMRAARLYGETLFTLHLREGDRVSPHTLSLCKSTFERVTADVVHLRTEDNNRTSTFETRTEYPVCGESIRTDMSGRGDSMPEKTRFLENPGGYRRAFRTRFLADPVLFPPETSLDEIDAGFRVVFCSRDVAELPGAHVISERKFSPEVGSPASGDRDEVRRLLQGAAAFLSFLRENESRDDHAFECAYAVLRKMMRLHRDLREAKNDANHHEIVSDGAAFAGDVESVAPNLYAIYRESRWPVQERDFIENVLHIKPASPSEKPVYETIPLVPASTTVSSPPAPADHATLFSNDYLSILSASIGYGRFAIDESGCDGYADLLAPPEGISNRTHMLLSARGDSIIKLHLKRKAVVTGFLNGTSDFSPYAPCRFSISGKRLARLRGPLDRTEECVLEPGYYELETASPAPEILHSFWAVAEYGGRARDENAILVVPCGSPIDYSAAFRNYAIRHALDGLSIRTEIVDFLPANRPDARESDATRGILDRLADAFKAFHESFVDRPGTGKPDEYRSAVEKSSAATVLFTDLEPGAPPCSFRRQSSGTRGNFDELLFPLPGGVRSIAAPVALKKDQGSSGRDGDFGKILERFDALGVCDGVSGEGIGRLIPLAPRPPERIADPILLLDREDWEKVADPNIRDEKPYLLLHLLEHNPDAFDLAKLLRSHFGYEIVFIPSAGLIEHYSRENRLEDIDRTVVIEPRGFLSFVRNAKYVLTDATCGVAFSLIFNRPFFALTGFEMPGTTESAITELLDAIDMRDRIVPPRDGNELTLNLEPSFTGIDEKLKTLRAGTLRFLSCFSNRPEDSVARETSTETPFPAPAPIRPQYPNPEFTIALPIYNMGPYIDDTVGSILASTYKNFRVIASDNASTDGTREKMRRWAKRDSRIIFLENEENTGPLGNSRRITSYMYDTLSYTRHMNWIDADDMIAPCYIDVLLRAFDRYEADAVFHQAIFIDEQGRYTGGGTKQKNHAVIARTPEEKALYFCKPAASDKCWNFRIRWRVNRKGLASPAIPARAHFDLDVNIRWLSACRRVVEIPDALYYRRLRPGSITNRTADESQLDAVLVYRSITNFLKVNDDWADYKELWLRYKLNHLVWLYGHVAPELRPRLVAAVVADMDREERWFYRETKFEAAQRKFLRETLKISEYQVAPDNVYPPLVPFDPRVDGSGTRPRNTGTDPGSGYCYENDCLLVHAWTVGAGRLGVGELGYGGPLAMPANIRTDTHTILGAHCPSKIHVTFKRPVAVTGFMNGTSPWSGNSNCRFSVSGTKIGTLFGPNDRTPETPFEPGTYELEISGLEPAYKHSAWAIREIKPERLESSPGPKPSSQRNEKKRKPGKKSTRK